jgi:CRP/FNR family transcriptional regulator, nitrogen oxide reductase regulator
MITLPAAASVLAVLPEMERRVLTSKSLEKSYKRGSTLFHTGERADFVWLVKKGRVHLSQFSSKGKTITKCVVLPGEVFCCLSSLDKKSYPSDAIAAVDSVAIRIPIDLFSGWMIRYPTFAQKVLCTFCERLRVAEQRGCQLQEPVRERILAVLINLRKKFGDTIPFTCREVAEMAGTTVETTIRVFTDLKKEKVLQMRRAKITLLDIDKIYDLVGMGG